MTCPPCNQNCNQGRQCPARIDPVRKDEYDSGLDDVDHDHEEDDDLS